MDLNILKPLFVAFAYLALTFSVVHLAAIALWSVLSRDALTRLRPSKRLLRGAGTGNRETAGVSIIMPAYNEAELIEASTRNALAQDYPLLEVVVVNDGSTDDTVERLRARYSMEQVAASVGEEAIKTMEIYRVFRSTTDPRLRLVDKAASGSKADNSNVGLNHANYPWVVVMDADEFMETNCISKCMAEAQSRPDDVVAVGTTLLPANDIAIDGAAVAERRMPTNFWVGCQIIEYLTAFLVSRPGMARIGAMPIVSGGFGLFRRESVLAVGGYTHGHLGEDMDMCVRLHRHHLENDIPYRIVQAPEAIVWTEFPPTHEVLRRQRLRWHRGLKMIIDANKQVIGRRRYGNFGRFGMGSLYVFEWCGPIVEAVGWFALVLSLASGWIEPVAALGMFLAAQLVGQLVGVLSVGLAVRTFSFLNRPLEVARLVLWAIVMNWGYRQLTLLWRLRSLFPGDTAWGEMPRSGFRTAGVNS